MVKLSHRHILLQISCWQEKQVVVDAVHDGWISGSFLKTQNTRNKKTKAAKFLKNDTQSQIFGSRWGTTTKNLLLTQSLTESYFLG